jgi:hypothetical protein
LCGTNKILFLEDEKSVLTDKIMQKTQDMAKTLLQEWGPLLCYFAFFPKVHNSSSQQPPLSPGCACTGRYPHRTSHHRPPARATASTRRGSDRLLSQLRSIRHGRPPHLTELQPGMDAANSPLQCFDVKISHNRSKLWNMVTIWPDSRCTTKFRRSRYRSGGQSSKVYHRINQKKYIWKSEKILLCFFLKICGSHRDSGSIQCIFFGGKTKKKYGFSYFGVFSRAAVTYIVWVQRVGKTRTPMSLKAWLRFYLNFIYIPAKKDNFKVSFMDKPTKVVVLCIFAKFERRVGTHGTDWPCVSSYRRGQLTWAYVFCVLNLLHYKHACIMHRFGLLSRSEQEFGLLWLGWFWFVIPVG